MYIEYAFQTKARISNVGSKYVSPPIGFPDGRTDMSDLHRRQTKISLASQDGCRQSVNKSAQSRSSLQHRNERPTPEANKDVDLLPLKTADVTQRRRTRLYADVAARAGTLADSQCTLSMLPKQRLA